MTANWLDGCLSHYAPREGVRTLRSTRIIKRTIIDEVMRAPSAQKPAFRRQNIPSATRDRPYTIHPVMK